MFKYKIIKVTKENVIDSGTDQYAVFIHLIEQVEENPQIFERCLGFSTDMSVDEIKAELLKYEENFNIEMQMKIKNKVNDEKAKIEDEVMAELLK